MQSEPTLIHSPSGCSGGRSASQWHLNPGELQGVLQVMLEGEVWRALLLLQPLCLLSPLPWCSEQLNGRGGDNVPQSWEVQDCLVKGCCVRFCVKNWSPLFLQVLSPMDTEQQHSCKRSWTCPTLNKAAAFHPSARAALQDSRPLAANMKWAFLGSLWLWLHRKVPPTGRIFRHFHTNEEFLGVILSPHTNAWNSRTAHLSACPTEPSCTRQPERPPALGFVQRFVKGWGAAFTRRVV